MRSPRGLWLGIWFCSAECASHALQRLSSVLRSFKYAIDAKVQTGLACELADLDHASPVALALALETDQIEAICSQDADAEKADA